MNRASESIFILQKCQYLFFFYEKYINHETKSSRRCEYENDNVLINKITNSSVPGVGKSGRSIEIYQASMA